MIYNIELKTKPGFDDVYNSRPEELVDLVMTVIKSKNIATAAVCSQKVSRGLDTYKPTN